MSFIVPVFPTLECVNVCVHTGLAASRRTGHGGLQLAVTAIESGQGRDRERRSVVVVVVDVVVGW